MKAIKAECPECGALGKVLSSKRRKSGAMYRRLGCPNGHRWSLGSIWSLERHRAHALDKYAMTPRMWRLLREYRGEG